MKDLYPGFLVRGEGREMERGEGRDGREKTRER